MEKLSDAKKRLSMSEKYNFLTKNYLESGMNDFVVVDHFSEIGSIPTESKQSKKHVYSFFTDIETLSESVLDFSDIHDEKCCQYLSREDAFPSYGLVTGDGKDEEYYYERIRGHHISFPGQIYPLTYHREFNTNRFDTRGKYNAIEICEDFRHFHGLYPKEIDGEPVDKYYKEIELNTEELIAVVRDDGDCCEVKIRKQDLCRYLHYTQRALVVQFRFDEDTTYSLADLDKIEDNFPLTGNEFCKIQGAIKYGNDKLRFGTSASWSLLQGLAILLPPPMGDGYSQEEAIKFCVGLDDRGNKEYLDLDDNWWCLSLEEKTKDVYFDSSILDHFYENNGSEYIIYDRFDDRSPSYRDILICSPDEYQFQIPLSFHNDDVVYCSVEQLGMPKKLLYLFQRYNIPPPSVSEINTRFRDLEVSLKKAYYSLRDWRPDIINLSGGEDESIFFKQIRIPRKVDQIYFDRLALQLVKLLIEGIQTVNFVSLVSKNSQTGEPYEWEKIGKIDALAILFKELEFDEEWKKHIAFLKSLQEYRSSSVAHAKPENWEELLKKLGVSTDDLRGGLATIFEKSKSFLEFLM
ncbi:MAG: hypothetical protein F4W91_08530 [Gemmatimonadetes bacterium]|nr:hypothetical protein [Gemmatimonadota bacterium]